MDQTKTGKFIAECRKQHNLTQAALAEKLGITDRAVSKWETGKSLPDAAVMLPLCDILEITVNELLTGERISMDNYKELAERKLAEMSEMERTKNRQLGILQYVFIFGAMAISLIMIICGSYIAADNSVIGLILIYSGGAYVTASAVIAALYEHDTGYFECPHCGHRHIPSRFVCVFAMHVGSDRYLKCPCCGKKNWHKKTLTKEGKENK